MYTLWFFVILFIVLISWSWGISIKQMKNKHPNYKGDDFLNWDKMKKYEDDLYK